MFRGVYGRLAEADHRRVRVAVLPAGKTREGKTKERRKGIRIRDAPTDKHKAQKSRWAAATSIRTYPINKRVGYSPKKPIQPVRIRPAPLV